MTTLGAPWLSGGPGLMSRQPLGTQRPQLSSALRPLPSASAPGSLGNHPSNSSFRACSSAPGLLCHSRTLAGSMPHPAVPQASACRTGPQTQGRGSRSRGGTRQGRRHRFCCVEQIRNEYLSASAADECLKGMQGHGVRVWAGWRFAVLNRMVRKGGLPEETSELRLEGGEGGSHVDT